MRSLKILSLVVFPVIASAQELPDPCEWETEDVIVSGLCNCRDTDNDIERLNCYDRLAAIQMAVRRVLLERAQTLAETEAGRSAMLEALGLSNDLDLNEPLGNNE